MSSTNFHQLNLNELDAAQRLFAHLVSLDRLPKQNTLEGLLVLREAWAEYDVASISPRFEHWIAPGVSSSHACAPRSPASVSRGLV